jgi:hypothetical protein
MRSRFQTLNMIALVAGLAAASPVVGGCFYHHRDGGGSWTVSEEPYYERWEHETKRDHRDYAQRSGDEQHEYWQWRQSHS